MRILILALLLASNEFGFGTENVCKTLQQYSLASVEISQAVQVKEKVQSNVFRFAGIRPIVDTEQRQITTISRRDRSDVLWCKLKSNQALARLFSASEYEEVDCAGLLQQLLPNSPYRLKNKEHVAGPIWFVDRPIALDIDGRQAFQIPMLRTADGEGEFAGVLYCKIPGTLLDNLPER